MDLKLKKIVSQTPISKSFIFEKPRGFRFYPGQFLDIEESKSFTISSSPTENFLMITTKAGKSKFKKHLWKLQPGDKIEASHPAGTFILDETAPAIFLAGGVGITPFRSMIKYALGQNLKLPITLIYSNSDSDFIFKNELDKWQKIYPKLTIHYIVTSQDGRLSEEKIKKFLHPKYLLLDTIYYLAGPPAMVDEFEIILLRVGVDSTNIRADRFDGY